MGGFHAGKGSIIVAGLSNIMIPPIIDSSCTCPPISVFMSLSGLFSAPLFLRDPAVVCSDGEGVGGVAGPVVVVTLPSTAAPSTRHFLGSATAQWEESFIWMLWFYSMNDSTGHYQLSTIAITIPINRPGLPVSKIVHITFQRWAGKNFVRLIKKIWASLPLLSQNTGESNIVVSNQQAASADDIDTSVLQYETSHLIPWY